MGNCVICNRSGWGGIFTNGDGYGDGKYVGVDVGEFKYYCNKCRKHAPDLDEKINQAFIKNNLCGFLEAWVGRCRKKNPCKKHSNIKCWKCNKLAITNCSIASSLVCGIPYCKDHPHEDTHYAPKRRL